MLTDFEYETIARDQLEAFKQILNQHKNGALTPGRTPLSALLENS